MRLMSAKMRRSMRAFLKGTASEIGFSVERRPAWRMIRIGNNACDRLPIEIVVRKAAEKNNMNNEH